MKTLTISNLCGDNYVNIFMPARSIYRPTDVSVISGSALQGHSRATEVTWFDRVPVVWLPIIDLL